MLVAALNLWNPHGSFTLLGAIGLAFALGMVHGITPDEHTWPITFSYSIGSYSTRRGMTTGLIFSLAFTLQRAIASELAYFTLANFLIDIPWLNYAIYILVGLAMFIAARYLFRGSHWHLLSPSHHLKEWSEPDSIQQPKPWMPAVHGFIAGWGIGAFALIIYTVLAPAMPSAAVGWVPGAAFGLGTTLVQVLAGALFGFIARRLSLTPKDIQTVALVTAGRTLLIGGIAFVAAGIFGLALPELAGFSITTGLHVHNLHALGIAQMLVIVIVVFVGFGTLITQTRIVAHQGKLARQETTHD
ncbi:MAG: urease accessory protein UreH domain-containing protein [Ferrimicrobium sp.]